MLNFHTVQVIIEDTETGTTIVNREIKIEAGHIGKFGELIESAIWLVEKPQ